jgi:hypothetical protein
MLYLHCGWPRTATSSLQRALSENADELAEVGILYPREWRGSKGVQPQTAHHGLAALFRSSSEPPVARFLSDLRSWDENVLLSTEEISNWLLPWRFGSLSQLLTSAAKVREITTVWTLRRLDEFFTSMYLHQVLLGHKLRPPSGFFDHRVEIGWVDGLIQGSAKIGALPGVSSIHTKYRRDGRHFGDLLQGVGVPDPVRQRILERIQNAPRTGERLTHKGMVTLLHLDVLSERLGIEIRRSDLVRVLRRRDLVFTDDSPVEIVDEATRRKVHAIALDASREHDFSPYIEFFEHEEVKGPSSPSHLDFEVLTDDDLQGVAAAIESAPQRAQAKPERSYPGS